MPLCFYLISIALLLSFGANAQDSSQSDKQRYRRSIEKADSSFEREAYELAREEYRSALDIFPEKEHPQKRIGKIEGILSEGEEDTATVEEEAKEKEKEEKAERDSTDNGDEDKTFMVVEDDPEFPGGQSAMMKFIQENLKYPENAVEEEIEARVLVRFVVNRDGTLSNIKVANDVPAILAEAAKKVVNKMPPWVPGEQRGKKVKVQVTIPIQFKLN